jgi:hypothetical protein
MSALGSVYRVWVAGLFALVVVQVATAGMGAFRTAHAVEETSIPLGRDTFQDFWNVHGVLGVMVALVAIALFAIAMTGRMREVVWLCFGLAAAAAVQVFLAGIAVRVPSLGFLHAVNALVIFGLAGYLAHRAWRPRS